MQERLKKRAKHRHKTLILCPECWHGHSPGPEIPEGKVACIMCGRVFRHQREDDTWHMTYQLGMCPGCHELVELTAGGRVDHYHNNRFGYPCAAGRRMPALRQDSHYPDNGD